MLLKRFSFFLRFIFCFNRFMFSVDVWFIATWAPQKVNESKLIAGEIIPTIFKSTWVLRQKEIPNWEWAYEGWEMYHILDSNWVNFRMRNCKKLSKTTYTQTNEEEKKQKFDSSYGWIEKEGREACGIAKIFL